MKLPAFVDEHEKELKHALGLEGSSHRYVRVSNYCDDVDKDMERTESNIPEIDADFLRFMTQVRYSTYFLLHL